MNPSPTPAAVRILVVDDAAALRAALRVFFVHEGYNVVGELASGGGVLEAVKQLKPDVVCLDYHLPDVNGLDLLRAIHLAEPAVAVVMITGDTNKDLETEAAEAGASGFIRKPFSQDRMAQEIRQAVHARALHQLHAPGQASFGVEPARARAVVADDSATMRRLLSAILHHARVEVVGEAADGQQAVAMVARTRPEIVCLDLDMPVLNGLDALEQIRQQSPDSQVLMITGRGGRDLVMQAAKRGARGYILKPFEPDRVLEAVEKLLG